MQVIVDRFEADYAVCEKEDKTVLNISKKKLPKNVKEGDVLLITEDSIVFDIEETDKRKKNILNKTKEIWK